MTRIIAALLAVLLPALLAAGQESGDPVPPVEASLKYFETMNTEHPLLAKAVCYGYKERADADQIEPPEDFGAQTSLFRVQKVTNGSFFMTLDPQGEGRLCVDADFDGSFAGETIYTGRNSQGGMMYLPGRTIEFGPVEVHASAGRPGAKLHILANTEVAMAFVYPAGFVSGRVALGDRSCRIAIVDADFDGSYAGVFEAGTARDWFAVDCDGDGKINADNPASGELMPLPRRFCLDGAWYSLSVSPDGLSVRLGPVTPAMGALDIGCPSALVTLYGDSGMVSIAPSEGPRPIPAGSYGVAELALFAKDKKNSTWKMQAEDLGPLEKFEVAEGETASLKVGPPFIVKVESAPQGELVSFGVVIVGQGGETYSAAVTAGRTAPAPKIRIIDSEGKVVNSGSFSYG